MIGEIQEFTPPIFYVINADLEEFPYYAEEWDEQLNETIQQLLNVINGEKIAPGLYLFSVESQGKSHVGKFAIVR